MKIRNISNILAIFCICTILAADATSFFVARNIDVDVDSEPGVIIQNSANIDASGTTIGIRQKKGGRFNLKVRVPKVKGKVVRITAEVDPAFSAFIKAPGKVIRGKKNKSRISFFLKVRKNINTVIPEGSSIEVPVTLTDVSNGGKEQFVLIIRD